MIVDLVVIYIQYNTATYTYILYKLRGTLAAVRYTGRSGTTHNGQCANYTKHYTCSGVSAHIHTDTSNGASLYCHCTVG